MKSRITIALPLCAGFCLAQGLFQPTKISTVHLSFTPEQFRGIAPAKSGGGINIGRGEWLQGQPGKRNGLASAMGIEFKSVHGSITIDDRPFSDVAVRYKGNGTYLDAMESRKFSYKVDLNKFIKAQTFAEVTTLNLHNNVTDPSWMNEPLAYRLYRDAKVPAPRTSYARVYLTVPGKYDNHFAGLYSIVENVDEHFIARNFANKNGALFKPVSTNLFNYLGPDWAKYNQAYDPKSGVTTEQKQRLIDFTRLVTQANDADFAVRLPEFVDLDEFARYMSVMVFLSDVDGILGPGQNFYLYLDPKTQKFTFLPWDQDHSFGQFPYTGSQEQRNDLSIQRPWIGRNRFLERVFAVDAFKKLYFARLEEFSRTIFDPQRFAAQVDEIAAVIRPAVQEESKLDRFDRAVAGTSRSMVPIKPFVKLRAKSLADQLAGKSRGSHIEGRY
ncbi:MAG: CotH kinase family protein [Candidatus Solibacter sp.]